MGYCVDWKGGLRLSKPMTKALAAEYRECEESEVWPGKTPDRRFNPWSLTADNHGIDVLTDKPGEWKDWLQYTVDHWLTPNGITVTGSCEWDGEERGDSGVITVEDGKVKARRKPNNGPKWVDLPVRARKEIIRAMVDAMEDDHSSSEPAWRAALEMLGGAPTSDRTVFDE